MIRTTGALVITAFLFTTSPFAASAQTLGGIPGRTTHPKIQGELGTGFGGFLVGITPCICADLGLLLSIAGVNGGDYLLSFRKKPKMDIGRILIGGPLLGGAEGSGTCGTRIDRGCKDKKSGKVIPAKHKGIAKRKNTPVPNRIW